MPDALGRAVPDALGRAVPDALGCTDRSAGCAVGLSVRDDVCKAVVYGQLMRGESDVYI